MVKLGFVVTYAIVGRLRPKGAGLSSLFCVRVSNRIGVRWIYRLALIHTRPHTMTTATILAADYERYEMDIEDTQMRAESLSLR